MAPVFTIDWYEKRSSVPHSIAGLYQLHQLVCVHPRKPRNDTTFKVEGMPGDDHGHLARKAAEVYSRYKPGGPFGIWVYFLAVPIQWFHELKHGKEMNNRYP